ncbi:MAG: LysR family transcriptional regulator, partial [Gammaproteobacteria bacterium]|nr:LysR family transcriptional regulator [Gammaproteobacteria bacterium]
VLGQTQPTVSRQISSLEDQLGVLLLERGTRGLTVTDTGQGLLVHVSAMGQAALKLSLAASGQSASIEGNVHLTATNAFATFHLPRILKRIKLEAPLVTITIITSNNLQDITKRRRIFQFVTQRLLSLILLANTSVIWMHYYMLRGIS